MTRSKHNGRRNQFRIIGGQWRGRRFTFIDAKGLRPTPDRVRETLFNWLQNAVRGAHCIDLFCGSGALGLEALSRGAQWVDFVDVNTQTIDHIDSALNTLQCGNSNTYAENSVIRLNQHASQSYDIAFIDPPFHHDLALKSCFLLEDNAWLNPGAFIYIESEQPLSSGQLPTNWQLHRHKQAGQVYYHLAKRGENQQSQHYPNVDKH